MNPSLYSLPIRLALSICQNKNPILAAMTLSIVWGCVLWAPHAYCFQGIAFKNESSWTYAGQDLPYIRLRNRWVFANMLSGFIKNEPFEFASVYKKGVVAAKNKDAARIKVEDAGADLLLFTRKGCGMWNTYDGSLQIMDTFRKCNYPHSYGLIVYSVLQAIDSRKEHTMTNNESRR